jgi:hypothetical protein
LYLVHQFNLNLIAAIAQKTVSHQINAVVGDAARTA